MKHKEEPNGWHMTHFIVHFWPHQAARSWFLIRQQRLYMARRKEVEPSLEKAGLCTSQCRDWPPVVRVSSLTDAYVVLGSFLPDMCLTSLKQVFTERGLLSMSFTIPETALVQTKVNPQPHLPLRIRSFDSRGSWKCLDHYLKPMHPTGCFYVCA